MAVALDDRQLVQAHQAGKADAFAGIVERYHGSLYGRALHRLGDPHAAEDAVQETFLRAFRALPRFNGEYRLGGWLRRILENVCADEGNRRNIETGATQRWASMPPVDLDLRTPDGVVDEMAARQRVDRVWRLLPPAQREALVLRFVHDLSFREVAAATGVSEENARARVSRARSVLRGMLGVGSTLAAFAFATLRRTERAAAQTAERVGQSGASQLLVDAGTSAGPAKAGVIAAAIGTVAASIAAPVALLLPADGGGRSEPATRPRPAAPLTASTPEAVPAIPAEAPAVTVDPVAREDGQGGGRVSTEPPVLAPPITVPPPASVPASGIAVTPPPELVSVLPEGLVELAVPVGELSIKQHGERIRMEGESLVLTGGLALTGDLEIRVRLEEGAAAGSAGSGRIRGRFEFTDAAGVTHHVRLNGELVETTDSGGDTVYHFEGELRSGGGSVPFATRVTVPNSFVPPAAQPDVAASSQAATAAGTVAQADPYSATETPAAETSPALEKGAAYGQEPVGETASSEPAGVGTPDGA